MNSLTVSITRDIIARSYRPGTKNEIDMIGNHCPRFDSLTDTPEERMGLPELTFEVVFGGKSC